VTKDAILAQFRHPHQLLKVIWMMVIVIVGCHDVLTLAEGKSCPFEGNPPNRVPAAFREGQLWVPTATRILASAARFLAGTRLNYSFPILVSLSLR
jgi:hypothetical protein